MKDLRKLVENPDKRRAILADCVEVLDGEVRSKGGLSGAAVKTAYAVVKAIKPGFVEKAFDGLIDDFTARLQEFFVRYQNEGSTGSLEAYLSARPGEVAESLLQVTDERADGKGGTAVKAYYKLRPKGKTHVEQAIPAVGRMLDCHVPSLSDAEA